MSAPGWYLCNWLRFLEFWPVWQKGAVSNSSLCHGLWRSNYSRKSFTSPERANRRVFISFLVIQWVQVFLPAITVPGSQGGHMKSASKIFQPTSGSISCHPTWVMFHLPSCSHFCLNLWQFWELWIFWAGPNHYKMTKSATRFLCFLISKKGVAMTGLSQNILLFKSLMGS